MPLNEYVAVGFFVISARIRRDALRSYAYLKISIRQKFSK